MAAKRKSQRAEVKDQSDRLSRRRLAERVYRLVLSKAGSLRDDDTGVFLAYLLGAIVKGKPTALNVVSFAPDDKNSVAFVHLLRTQFPDVDDDVWEYIELEDSNEVMPTKALNCLILGGHLINCDADGYCNDCGEQLGQGWADALYTKVG